MGAGPLLAVRELYCFFHQTDRTLQNSNHHETSRYPRGHTVSSLSVRNRENKTYVVEICCGPPKKQIRRSKNKPHGRRNEPDGRRRITMTRYSDWTSMRLRYSVEVGRRLSSSMLKWLLCCWSEHHGYFLYVWLMGWSYCFVYIT